MTADPTPEELIARLTTEADLIAADLAFDLGQTEEVLRDAAAALTASREVVERMREGLERAKISLLSLYTAIATGNAEVGARFAENDEGFKAIRQLLSDLGEKSDV